LIERDGRGHDGACKTAPADLVDAGDQVEPQPPYRVLERPESADLDHRRVAGRSTVCFLAASFIRAALPFSSRRKYASRDGPGGPHDVNLVDDRRMQRKMRSTPGRTILCAR
jgi:hypothetical protein